MYVDIYIYIYIYIYCSSLNRCNWIATNYLLLSLLCVSSCNARSFQLHSISFNCETDLN